MPLASRFRAALLGSLLTVAGPAVAKDAQIPESAIPGAHVIQKQALAGSGAYEIVESLTTEVGPRLVGTPGDAAGVAWAVRTMQELGFQNVRAEPVQGVGWVRGRETAETTAPFRQTLQVTALGGSGATPAEGIAAEIVVFDTLADLMAAPDGSLAGKIAYINERTPKLQDGGGYGLTSAGRTRGPAVAAQKGAAAFLLRSAGTANHRFPHTGVTVFPGNTPRIPAGAISNSDANLIERMLERGGPVTLRLTLTPTLPGPVTTHNVVGDIPGAEAPEEIVLLGAHLDSWDLGTGAVDDGAGVGIVLAAGKLIMNQPTRPRRTIRVVLYGAEEVGLVGAYAYAEAHKDQLETHIVGTEADFGAGPVLRFSTRFAPETRAAGEVIHKALRPLGITRGDNRASGGPDLTPLRNAGMPVATLQLDGTDYFDTHHTANDTLDRIDRRAIDQSTAAYATFAWMAAHGTGQFRPAPVDETPAPLPANLPARTGSGGQ